MDLHVTLLILHDLGAGVAFGGLVVNGFVQVWQGRNQALEPKVLLGKVFYNVNWIVLAAVVSLVFTGGGVLLTHMTKELPLANIAIMVLAFIIVIVNTAVVLQASSRQIIKVLQEGGADFSGIADRMRSLWASRWASFIVDLLVILIAIIVGVLAVET